MSITYREVLNSRNFRDFKLIAGKYGVGKSFEFAIALENSFKNIKKVESGWLINLSSENLTRENISHILKMGYTGIGIKLTSSTFSEEVIDFCNEADLPLIGIPEGISYINIVRFADNIILDNRVKKMYDIITTVETKDHDMKIIKTLTSLSRDIERDVNVYDLLHKKIYSGKGKVINNIDIREYESIWNPQNDFEKRSLSEKINMFFLVNNEIKELNEKIILPFELEGETLAYLVVDSEKNYNYNLISSIKFYFMIIMYEYKMLYSEVSQENKARDKIIKDIVEGRLEIDDSDFVKEFGKHKMRPYTAIAFRQLKKDLNMFMRRDRLTRCIHKHIDKNDVFLGILDYNEMVLLVAEDRESIGTPLNITMENITHELQDDMKGAKFLSGINGGYNGIEKLEDIYRKSVKCLDIGSIILKESNVYTCDDIGPFMFFNIDELKKDREVIFNDYIKPLLNEDDGKELVLTLNAYLNCNLNISKTAQKMYLHNNTIRYRINKIEDLLLISLKDYFSRLKLEVALMFLDILN